MITKLILGSAVLLSGLMAANGIFMLVAPLDWYMAIPGVTMTGPFNQHFLRDIGLIFLFNSSAFAVGAAKPEYRRALWCSATLWLSAHALFHVWEVASRNLWSPRRLVRDFAAVSSPALVGRVADPLGFQTRWAGDESVPGPLATSNLGSIHWLRRLHMQRSTGRYAHRPTSRTGWSQSRPRSASGICYGADRRCEGLGGPRLNG